MNKRKWVLLGVALAAAVGILTAVKVGIHLRSRADGQVSLTMVSSSRQGRSHKGDYGLQSGVLVQRPGRPLVLFMTAAKPNEPRKIPVLVVLKLRPSQQMIPEAGCSSRAELLGHEEMKASFELLIEGRGVKWDYHLRAATDTPKGKTPAQETLRVGFPTPLEKIDPSAGNVYVIDLTQASVRIKRLTIDLPTGFKPIEPKGKSVDSLLAPILSKIEQASPETFR